MKKNLHMTRVAAAVVASTLALTAVPAVGMNGMTLTVMAVNEDIPHSIYVEKAEAEEYLDFSKKAEEDEGFTTWSDGNNATYTYSEDKAVIASKWWGEQDWWTVQYAVQNLTLSEGENTVEFDITSTFDKPVYYKLTQNASDTPIAEERVELKTGEKTHLTLKANITSSDTYRVFYNLGGGQNTDGSVTIENFTIKDTDGNPVNLYAPKKPAAVKKGLEYDFTDNSGDYADPGTDKAGYELIWADEFDGNYNGANVDSNTGLNLDNWAYQLGDGSTDCGNYGWGNQELQCYTADKKNVGVNEDLSGDGNPDGLLRITAAYEANGYNYASESTKNYTSARLRTTKPDGELFNTTYGYIEARISLPQTAGAWPAFWMLPESTDIYGGWPVSGEIDILETTGTHADEACSTLHRGAPVHDYKGSGYTKLDSEIRYFHTYAVDWKPGQMDFYYDGKIIYTADDWKSGFADASDALTFDAPFDQPFYAILNLAVDSGNFGGTANKAKFNDEINMYVDYVRAYQKTDGYADYATKADSNSAASDWASYAGQNQIADITTNNLVVDGGGHDDLAAKGDDNWHVSNQADAAATGNVVNVDGTDYVKVDVNKAGSADYGVQLIGHYDAKKGYTYKVSYDIYATGDLVGKKVNCDSKEYSGWSTYGSKQIKLNAEPTSEAFFFVQSDNFENCRIEFNIGGVGTGTVYIGNVKVEIVDPSATSLVDENGARPTPDNGNMIYNGTFDQGDKHFGYWYASNGTTVSIPRYTLEALKDDDVKVVDVASKTNYEKISDGVKYYERRAQISAADGKSPTIYQAGIKMPADTYTINFDMYSKTDSAVKFSIYSVENGVLSREIASTTALYKAGDGVRNITLKTVSDEDLANGAVVLTFAKNTEVQIDNVEMKGANQQSTFNEHPLDKANPVTWTGDDGAGNGFGIVQNDGVVKMPGITSGGTWYSPQLGCDGFQIKAGKKYNIEFKFKLDGTTNNTFEYILQESGSWIVARDVTKVKVSDCELLEDGFYLYKDTFTAAAGAEGIRLNFGFGNSAASNATFTLKEADICVVKSAVSDSDTADDSTNELVDNMFDSIVDNQPAETPDDNQPGQDTPEEENPESPVVVPSTPVQAIVSTIVETNKKVVQTITQAVEQIQKNPAKTVQIVAKTTAKVVSTVAKAVKSLFGAFNF